MTPYERPEQYYDITNWTPTEINQARRGGHLADLLAGVQAPDPNAPTEQENNE